MNIVSKFEIVLRKLAQMKSERLLRKNSELWTTLSAYLEKTKSTGCGYIDYAFLYKMIRSTKPVEILECGTGVSTLIIAHALMENERETGRGGRVTSMDEHNVWLDMSRNLLPNEYKKFVDFKVSATVEDRYSIFRGVRYENIPSRAYDFLFIDGPKYTSPVDGAITFDFDYLHVLRNSDQPVGCSIDKRVSTCFVLQQLLGADNCRYSAVLGLGIVRPCTRNDLGSINTLMSSKNFKKSFRLLGNSRLAITDNK